MDRMIYTAMSGARHALDQQSVISHNLANVTTTGFRAQFSMAESVPVASPAHQTRASVITSTPGSDFSTGSITTTGRELDVAINGNGWLAVKTADGSEAYTRRGDLQVDNTGLLLVAGRPVVGDGGPITLPLEAQMSMGRDGTISAIGVGEDPEALVSIARLKLVDPGDEELIRGEDGLFRMPPGEDGTPRTLPQSEEVNVIAGTLESSNVSAVESMVSMIDNARRYEMQLKVIETADENAQRANSLLSLQR